MSLLSSLAALAILTWESPERTGVARAPRRLVDGGIGGGAPLGLFPQAVTALLRNSQLNIRNEPDRQLDTH